MNIFVYLLISIGLNLLMFIPAFKFKTDKLTDLSYALSFIILIIMAFFLNSFSWMKLILTLMIVFWALRLGIFLFIRIRKMKKDRRFDEMRGAFFKFLRFWLLQGLTVWVILIPSLFFIDSSSNAFFFVGFIIWLLGLVIESIADLQKYKFKQKKNNKNKFINIGLWKYSRHPNYFGEILCWLGIYVFVSPALSLTNRVFSLASPIFIIVLLLFVSGIPLLEKAADKKWSKNKEYQEYKRKTSILIPWLRRK